MDHKIPYDYTVEVRYRFKGLDLIDRVPDELWTEVRTVLSFQGPRVEILAKNLRVKDPIP